MSNPSNIVAEAFVACRWLVLAHDELHLRQHDAALVLGAHVLLLAVQLLLIVLYLDQQAEHTALHVMRTGQLKEEGVLLAQAAEAGAAAVADGRSGARPPVQHDHRSAEDRPARQPDRPQTCPRCAEETLCMHPSRAPRS